jgi:hypothetical protein
MKNFTEPMIDFLEQYDNKKKEEGFIPTVEMLLEELKALK